MNVCVKVVDLQDLVNFANLSDREVSALQPTYLTEFISKSTDMQLFTEIITNKNISIDLADLFNRSIKRGNTPQVDYLAKMFIEKNIFIDYYQYNNISELALLYESNKSQIIKDYIIYYINKNAIKNRMKQKKVLLDALRYNPLIDLLSKRHNDLVKEIILQIDDPLLYIKDDALDTSEEKYRKILKNIYGNATVVDTALGLRQTNLPPEVVEQIINDAYNTRSTMGLFETMEHIEPIINPTPGVTKAGRHPNFRDANLYAKRFDDADEDESDVTEDES